MRKEFLLHCIFQKSPPETKFCKIFNQQLHCYDISKFSSETCLHKWYSEVLEDVHGIIHSAFFRLQGGYWHLGHYKADGYHFTAFNHKTYQKIVSKYIAADLCMPTSIFEMFRAGCLLTLLFCWSGSTPLSLCSSVSWYFLLLFICPTTCQSSYL